MPLDEALHQEGTIM